MSTTTPTPAALEAAERLEQAAEREADDYASGHAPAAIHRLSTYRDAADTLRGRPAAGGASSPAHVARMARDLIRRTPTAYPEAPADLEAAAEAADRLAAAARLWHASREAGTDPTRRALEAAALALEGKPADRAPARLAGLAADLERRSSAAHIAADQETHDHDRADRNTEHADDLEAAAHAIRRQAEAHQAHAIPPHIAAHVETLKAGRAITASAETLEALEALDDIAPTLASVPNPDRIGTRDTFRAYLKR